MAGLVAAILIPIIVLLPAQMPSSDLKRTAVVFLITIALWITESIPIAMTALLAIILQPLFHIADLPSAFTSFISPAFFFVMVMFIIAQAVAISGLDRRFACWLLTHAGTDSRRVLLVLMIGTATLSLVISDVPCAAIFMAIALGIFERQGLQPGKSTFAKSVMIGIPIASLIGGVGTPAGSSINILGLGFIEQYGNMRVPFLHWMLIGIPMVIVLIPVSAWTLTRFFPPEIKNIGSTGDLQMDLERLGPMRSQEWKVIGIMGTMIVLWVASTWIRQLDTVLIAVAGAVVMFLPGMNLFGSWKEAERAIGWDSLMMIGGVTSLGAASAKTGLAKWLVDACLGGLQQWDPVWVIVVISAFTVVMHLVVPINPVIVSVMIPPIVLLAGSSGHNAAFYALPVVFTASCAFLLPLDAVPLVTYGKGYYRMFDMFLPGLIISICWVAMMAALLMLFGPALGLK
jgi:sodium-dependent dicarboxylate transporter 2/3/5